MLIHLHIYFCFNELIVNVVLIHLKLYSKEHDLSRGRLIVDLHLIYMCDLVVIFKM